MPHKKRRVDCAEVVRERGVPGRAEVETAAKQRSYISTCMIHSYMHAWAHVGSEGVGAMLLSSLLISERTEQRHINGCTITVTWCNTHLHPA